MDFFFQDPQQVLDELYSNLLSLQKSIHLQAGLVSGFHSQVAGLAATAQHDAGVLADLDTTFAAVLAGSQDWIEQFYPTVISFTTENPKCTREQLTDTGFDIVKDWAILSAKAKLLAPLNESIQQIQAIQVKCEKSTATGVGCLQEFSMLLKHIRKYESESAGLRGPSAASNIVVSPFNPTVQLSKIMTDHDKEVFCLSKKMVEHSDRIDAVVVQIAFNARNHSEELPQIIQWHKELVLCRLRLLFRAGVLYRLLSKTVVRPVRSVLKQLLVIDNEAWRVSEESVARSRAAISMCNMAAMTSLDMDARFQAAMGTVEDAKQLILLIQLELKGLMEIASDDTDFSGYDRSASTRAISCIRLIVQFLIKLRDSLAFLQTVVKTHLDRARGNLCLADGLVSRAINFYGQSFLLKEKIAGCSGIHSSVWHASRRTTSVLQHSDHAIEEHKISSLLLHENWSCTAWPVSLKCITGCTLSIKELYQLLKQTTSIMDGAFRAISTQSETSKFLVTAGPISSAAAPEGGNVNDSASLLGNAQASTIQVPPNLSSAAFEGGISDDTACLSESALTSTVQGLPTVPDTSFAQGNAPLAVLGSGEADSELTVLQAASRIEQDTAAASILPTLLYGLPRQRPTVLITNYFKPGAAASDQIVEPCLDVPHEPKNAESAVSGRGDTAGACRDEPVGSAGAQPGVFADNDFNVAFSRPAQSSWIEALSLAVGTSNHKTAALAQVTLKEQLFQTLVDLLQRSLKEIVESQLAYESALCSLLNAYFVDQDALVVSEHRQAMVEISEDCTERLTKVCSILEKLEELQSSLLVARKECHQLFMQGRQQTVHAARLACGALSQMETSISSHENALLSVTPDIKAAAAGVFDDPTAESQAWCQNFADKCSTETEQYKAVQEEYAIVYQSDLCLQKLQSCSCLVAVWSEALKLCEDSQINGAVSSMCLPSFAGRFVGRPGCECAICRCIGRYSHNSHESPNLALQCLEESPFYHLLRDHPSASPLDVLYLAHWITHNANPCDFTLQTLLPYALIRIVFEAVHVDPDASFNDQLQECQNSVSLFLRSEVTFVRMDPSDTEATVQRADMCAADDGSRGLNYQLSVSAGFFDLPELVPLRPAASPLWGSVLLLSGPPADAAAASLSQHSTPRFMPVSHCNTFLGNANDMLDGSPATAACPTLVPPVAEDEAENHSNEPSAVSGTVIPNHQGSDTAALSPSLDLAAALSALSSDLLNLFAESTAYFHFDGWRNSSESDVEAESKASFLTRFKKQAQNLARAAHSVAAAAHQSPQPQLFGVVHRVSGAKGQCLFRCLSFLLGQPDADPAVQRRLMFDQLQSNPDQVLGLQGTAASLWFSEYTTVLKVFNPDSYSGKEYFQGQLQSGVLELAAAAQQHNRTILVLAGIEGEPELLIVAGVFMNFRGVMGQAENAPDWCLHGGVLTKEQASSPLVLFEAGYLLNPQLCNSLGHFDVVVLCPESDPHQKARILHRYPSNLNQVQGQSLTDLTSAEDDPPSPLPAILNEAPQLSLSGVNSADAAPDFPSDAAVLADGTAPDSGSAPPIPLLSEQGLDQIRVSVWDKYSSVYAGQDWFPIIDELSMCLFCVACCRSLVHIFMTELGLGLPFFDGVSFTLQECSCHKKFRRHRDKLVSAQVSCIPVFSTFIKQDKNVLAGWVATKQRSESDVVAILTRRCDFTRFQLHPETAARRAACMQTLLPLILYKDTLKLFLKIESHVQQNTAKLSSAWVGERWGHSDEHIALLVFAALVEAVSRCQTISVKPGANYGPHRIGTIQWAVGTVLSQQFLCDPGAFAHDCCTMLSADTNSAGHPKPAHVVLRSKRVIKSSPGLGSNFRHREIDDASLTGGHWTQLE